MTKTIVIVGTLDTKGEEVKYLKERIEERGHRVIVMDIGVLGKPYLEPDIGHEEIAQAGGQSLSELIASNEEGKAMEVMAEGTLKIAKRLLSEGSLDGILAIGGTTGSTVGLAVSRGLPLGIPKLLLIAGSSFMRPELGASDLVIMPSIGDLWGINRITKGVLDKASGAISGMVENYSHEIAVLDKPAIGITTLGTAGLRYVPLLKAILEERGHETVVFIPALADTESLKNLIEEGQIGALLDLCLIEFANRVCNSNAWGPGIDRIKVAAEKGIPLVVSPGCVGYFVWRGSPDKLPPDYEGRQARAHNPLAYTIKTITEEKIKVAKNIAEDLNRARGQAAVIIPTRGFSEFDKEGGIFYDPDGCKAFMEALTKWLKPEVRLIALDAHINDEQFARKAAEIMDIMIRERCNG